MSPDIVWLLVSLACNYGMCVPLQPQPPRMEFETPEACHAFAVKAAYEGGVYDCVRDEGS
jgi:hypothetical protein